MGSVFPKLARALTMIQSVLNLTFGIETDKYIMGSIFF